MEILLSENKKVKLNKSGQWVFSIRTYNAKKDKFNWKDIWFYHDLEICYFDVLNEGLAESEKESLKEAFDYVIEQLEILRKWWQEHRK